MKTKHTSENKKFDATLPENLRDQWLTMIRAWESDSSNPNPYTHVEKGTSGVLHFSLSFLLDYQATNLAEVRRKLAEADEEEIARGTISHQVPGSVFVRNGLDIEEQQSVPLQHSYIDPETYHTIHYRRQLAAAIKKKAPKSDHQIASVQERRNGIMREIKKWQEVQLVYMPGVVTTPFRAPEDTAEDNDIERAESVPLVLPSSLDSESRGRVCLQNVANHEQLFRLAQVKDSLIELRHSRKIRRTVVVNHHTQIAGQGVRTCTRSRAALNTVDARITKFVERYRAAYHALLQLDPTGSWRETYLELKDSDNRGPGKETEEVGVGDGSYFRSWIWSANPRNPDTVDGDVGEEGASEEDVNEMLRVEWTTAFARLERWSEEVELLQEEMRRVVAFLEWKSLDWLAKMDARAGDVSSDVQSGLRAYAQKQAAIFHNLAVSFAMLWYPTLVSYDLRHSWITEFLDKHKVPPPNVTKPTGPTRGIFKFRVSEAFKRAVSKVTTDTPKSLVHTRLSTAHQTAHNDLPLELSSVNATSGDHPSLESLMVDATTSNPPLEEASDSQDSGLDDSDSDSEADWDDDLDL